MYHLIGIKGTGMAALACILHDLGNEVQGSDLDKHFFTQDPLDERKIKIMDFSPDNIIDNQIVIIGNAFHDDFPEVAAALANPTVKSLRYHQFIGQLMMQYEGYGVAGSHGKTTTTTMLSTMLREAFPTGYLIGDGTGFIPVDAVKFVLEACEFRHHFLAYYPRYAIVTNVDWDHVDYFKTKDDYLHAYEQFALNVKDRLIICGDDAEAMLLKIDPAKVLHYGLMEHNDYQAVEVNQGSEWVNFKVLKHGEFLGEFNLPLVGIHMLSNALACIVIGDLNGMSVDVMQRGLAAFKGAKRRYVITEYHGSTFIDDYAHHPTEVAMTLKATRTRFPGQRIVAIFKPHRASRLKTFVTEFAEALRLADQSGVCEFTSIDDFDDGTRLSVDYLTNRVPGCRVFFESAEDVAYLASLAPAVYVFMSSKDIYDFADEVKLKIGENAIK